MWGSTQALAQPGGARRAQVLTLEFWRAISDWYQYMGAAAAAVAGANADALIIAGGSDSESLLSYIATQPLLPPGAPGHECARARAPPRSVATEPCAAKPQAASV
jgi:hypothetical protein